MSNPLQPSFKIRLFNGKKANLDDFKSAGLVAFGKDFMDIEGCVDFPVTYEEQASLLTTLNFTIGHFGDVLLYYLYIGQSVQFYGGYYDENKLDFQRVFTGTVTRIKTHFSNTGKISIRVECMSYGFTKMGKDARNFVYPDSQSSRRFAQLPNLTVEQIVRGIIEENGFSVGEIALPATGSLPRFDNRNPKYQKDMSDWQFLNSLADDVGCSVWMSTEDGRDVIYFMSKDKAFHRQSSDISFVFRLDGHVTELKDSEIIKARDPSYNRPRLLTDLTVDEDIAAANSVTRTSMKYNKDTGEYEELMSKIEVDKDGREIITFYELDEERVRQVDEQHPEIAEAIRNGGPTSMEWGTSDNPKCAAYYYRAVKTYNYGKSQAVFDKAFYGITVSGKCNMDLSIHSQRTYLIRGILTYHSKDLETSYYLRGLKHIWDKDGNWTEVDFIR